MVKKIEITSSVDLELEGAYKLTDDTTDFKTGRLTYPIEKVKNDVGAFIDFKILDIIGPTAKGELPKSSFSFLPTDDMKTSQATVREYESLKRSNPEIYAEANGDAIVENAKKKYEVSRNARDEQNRQARENLFKKTEFTERTLKPREGSIRLYLPVSFQQNDGLNYSSAELGVMGASALEGMNKGGTMLGALGDAMKNGVQSIFDLVSGELSGPAAVIAAQRLASKKVPSEISEAFKIATAVTVNPNLRSTFKGVNLREFSFTFKFMARSSKEAETVEKIIKTFRSSAYPESVDLGPISAGYHFPDLFAISVYFKNEDGKRKRIGNRIKNCYLRSISTNYNPTSMAFHIDGQPVEIDLSLNFVEEVTISKKDIEDGF